MKTINHLQILCLLSFFLLSSNTFAEDGSLGSHYAFYPLGGTFHFKVTDETNNGNLNYLAITKTKKIGDWNIEQGIGTFIDTYHTRSYVGFSDISHNRYKYGMITPILSATCAYKGYKHSTKKRRLQCFPLFKLQLAKNKGFVVKIIPIPKFKKVTNGQLSFEIGYKF